MRAECGQAGVETLIALPLLALLLLAGAETSAWVASTVLAGSAADAGARAIARGASAREAARAELPGLLRRGARVTIDDGVVHVVLRVPTLVPGVPALRVSAEAGP